MLGHRGFRPSAAPAKAYRGSLVEENLLLALVPVLLPLVAYYLYRAAGGFETDPDFSYLFRDDLFVLGWFFTLRYSIQRCTS